MTLILCADDFAQNKEISEGILELAYQRRLSAISCMTTMPLWPELAAYLPRLDRGIQMGVHFNLTHGQASYIKPLSYWLILSSIGRINAKLIGDIFNQQCDSFEDKLGRAPDFIDGHQHVHALPGIREVIIEIIKKRYSKHIPNIRNLNFVTHQKKSFKTDVLKYFTRGLTPLLIQNNIPHNTYFAGVYDLKPQSNFKSLINQWFQNSPPNTLIMCHPGLASSDKTDPIAATRFKEFEVLNSDWFAPLARHLF